MLNVGCLEDYYSILLLRLESPDLLPSYSVISSTLYNTIILIITHTSFNH